MVDIFSERDKNLLNRVEKRLVGYFLSGYPALDSFLSVVEKCETLPVDVLEIGFPSNNPYCDGEVIAKAHRSVDHKNSCSLKYWSEIRKRCTKPIWLMAYKSDFIDSLIYRDFVSKHLIDALVIPDMNVRQRIALAKEVSVFDVDVIGFSNPEMNKEELKYVFENFSLVYEQLYVGQTGNGNHSDAYLNMLDESRKFENVFGFAGFGISTLEHVMKKYQEGFDGAIIGTAIIKHLNKSSKDMETYLEEIGRAKTQWN